MAAMAGQVRTAYLGLGSNLGDRQGYLARARQLISRLPGTALRRQSRVYETAPLGVTGQPDFLNQVVEVATTLSPRELLAHLKEIEAELGRRPGRRWQPREIDIDLLEMEGVAVAEPDLVVPHPRLAQRAFVLVPLAELAPHLVLPTGQTAAQAAQALRRSQRVEPVGI